MHEGVFLALQEVARRLQNISVEMHQLAREREGLREQATRLRLGAPSPSWHSDFTRDPHGEG